VETGDTQPVRVQEIIHADPETPFPRIRGEHLERLFFSVPEHNAKTCGVCYRKRDRRYIGASSSWTKPASRSQHKEALREKHGGHDEGSVDEVRGNTAPSWGRRKGKLRDQDAFLEDPEHLRNNVGKNQGLPPQTVVTRVIRELEGDFTHYKRLVAPILTFNMNFTELSFTPAYMWNWRTNIKLWMLPLTCGGETR
jgi:hypothetical protein